MASLTPTSAFAALLLAQSTRSSSRSSFDPGLFRFLTSLTESTSVLDETVDTFALRCLLQCTGTLDSIREALALGFDGKERPTVVDFYKLLEVGGSALCNRTRVFILLCLKL
jgi:hypothetical protein